MSLPLLLLVLSVATFRATRLITRDDFPPIWHTRRWLVSRRQDHVQGDQRVHWWLGELISCHWCASGWVSMGLVGFVWLVWGLALPVICWLAVWGMGAVLVDRLG